jgi:hypothetical protein
MGLCLYQNNTGSIDIRYVTDSKTVEFVIYIGQNLINTVNKVYRHSAWYIVKLAACLYRKIIPRILKN